MSTRERKDQHLDICLTRDVSSGHASDLRDFRLEYDALPDINLADVDPGCELLGKRLSAPVIVGALTGGTPRGAELNARIARVCARLGLGMTLGSQRVMLEDAATAEGFAVRHVAPKLPLLIGNIGAVQLNLGVSAADVARLHDLVDADAMAFHLNPLQEAVQPEGDTQFGGLSARLREVVAALPFPCIAKEVGSGLSERTARKLAAAGLDGVETAALGGTSWTRVESYRCAEDDPRRLIGENLAGFGVTASASILACRDAFPDGLVIASGGVRSGLDAATAIALGADAVALAAPALAAAHESEEALEHRLRAFVEELRVVMFATGSRDLAALRGVRLLPREVGA